MSLDASAQTRASSPSLYTHTLANGLRVVIEPAPQHKMTTVNLIYQVGSCDESPEATGMAHLHEHVMFTGSKHVPHYDHIIEMIGGTNNAYTSQDVTSYWVKLPTAQLEVALWVEADRMLHLMYDQTGVEVQRKVVLEEFKQTTIDQPYGDVWAEMLKLAFTQHPYQWATIGKSLEQIQQMAREDLIAFGARFYLPQNSVLAIVGDVDPQQTIALVGKWFGDIPGRTLVPRVYPQEPKQTAHKQSVVTRDVPQDALYKAYKIPPRAHADYAALQLLGHVLAEGEASMLHQSLVHDRQLCTQVEAYPAGQLQAGLFWLGARLQEGIALEEADKQMQEVLAQAKEPLAAELVTRAKNQYLTDECLERTSVAQRAECYAYGLLLGDAYFFENELRQIQALSAEDIQDVAQRYLQEANASTLYYQKQR